MQTETQTPEPSVTDLVQPPMPPRNERRVETPKTTANKQKVAQRGGKAIGAAAAKAKASGKAKAAPAKVGKAKYTDTMKITVVAKKNPHREGTTAYQRFQLFKTGMTVGAWRQAAIKAKLAKDGHGHLRVYVGSGKIKVA